MRLRRSSAFVMVALCTAAPSGQDATGIITVRVRGAQPDLPVRINIESRRGSRIATLRVGAPPVITRENLEHGTYYVSAVQENGRAAAIKTVPIDQEHPAGAAEVELAENRSSLVVADEQWNPIPNTKAVPVSPAQYLMAAKWPSLAEVAPGEFSLDGLPPGMFVKVRADGFSPACVIVPRNDRAFIRLETGRTVEVRLPRDMTPAVVKELSAIAGIPGSDCPVGLAEFRPQVIGRYDLGQPGTFRFEHFPSASRFELIRFPSDPRQIVVPDRGDVLVETFEQRRVP